MPSLDLSTYQQRFTTMAQKVGFKLSGNYENDIIALAKIYKSTGANSAKDVVYNQPITAQDVESMLTYFTVAADNANVATDENNLVYVDNVERSFLEGMSQLTTSDLENMDEASVKEFRSFSESYKNLFSGFREQGLIPAPDAQSLNSLKTIEVFSDIAAKKKYTGIFMTSVNEKNAANVVSLMAQPVTEGKTIAEISAKYPVNNAGRTYIEELLYSVSNGGAAGEIGKYGETKSNDYYYSIMNDQYAKTNNRTMEQAYYDAIALAENNFNWNGGVIKEYDKLAPVVFNVTNVPEYDIAVKRIADDAMKSLTAHEQSLHGEDLSGDITKMVEAYRASVEKQVKRLLLESDYESKCRTAFYKDELNADIENFVRDEKFPTNVLPFFFTKDMADDAAKAALDEIKDEYPQAQADLANFNSAMGYSDDKSGIALVTRDALAANPEINMGLSGNYGETMLGTYAGEVLGIYNLYEKVNDSDDFFARNHREIINFKLTPDNIQNIDALADRFDDVLIANNPQLSKSINNSIVKDNIGTCTDIDGNEVADATQLFLIGGENVDNYIQSRLGIINRGAYNRLPQDEKIKYRKAAIMQAALVDEPPVTAKYYIQKSDYSVEVRACTIVNNSGFYVSDYKHEDDKEKEEDFSDGYFDNEDLLSEEEERKPRVNVNFGQNVIEQYRRNAIEQLTNANIDSLNKLRRDDFVAAVINSEVNASKRLLHSRFNSSLQTNRGSERIAQITAHTQYLSANPGAEAREIQEEMINVPAATGVTLHDTLPFSTPADVAPVSVISGISSAQQENLIRNIDFNKLNAESLYPAVNRFDDLILKNNEWLANSLKDKDVALAHRMEQKKFSVELKPDVTKLFYIDGKTVEEYLKGRMSDYSKYSPEEREYLGKMAVMNALVTGGHTIDAKGYVQEGNGPCQLKVSNLVYEPVFKNFDSAYEDFNTVQARARAERIIAADTVADTVNAGLKFETDRLIRDVQENEENLETSRYRLAHMYNVQIPENTQFYDFIHNPNVITGLSSANVEPEVYIPAPPEEDNTQLMQDFVNNLKFSVNDFADDNAKLIDIKKDTAVTDKLFNDVVLKNNQWIADSMNNSAVYKDVNGDITKLFSINNVPVDTYLNYVMGEEYANRSDEEKQALGKAAILRALTMPETHVVDVKGYVKNGRQCAVKACQLHYDRVRSSTRIMNNRQFNTPQYRVTNILANDTLASRINTAVEDRIAGEAITLAKMYKMYKRSQNGKVFKPEELLFNDCVISEQDITDVETLINSRVPGNATAPSEVTLSDLGNYYTEELNKLDLSKVAGFENIAAARNNPQSISRLANTVSYLNDIQKTSAIPADKKSQSSLINLSTMTEALNNLNSIDPSKALAASMVYNMFAPVLQGKTVEQIAEKYPMNDAGKTYLSLAAEEIGKAVRSLPDISEDDVKEYQANGSLPDVNKSRALEAAYFKAVRNINDNYYGKTVTKGELDANAELTSDHVKHFTEISAHGSALNDLSETIYYRHNPDNSHVIKDEDLPKLLNIAKQDYPDFEKAVDIIVDNSIVDKDVAANNIDKAVLSEYKTLAKDLLKRNLINDGYLDKCRQVRNRQDLINDMNEFIDGSTIPPYFFKKDAIVSALHDASLRIRDTHNVDIPFNYQEKMYDFDAKKPELLNGNSITMFPYSYSVDDTLCLKHFDDKQYNLDIIEFGGQSVNIIKDFSDHFSEYNVFKFFNWATNPKVMEQYRNGEVELRGDGARQFLRLETASTNQFGKIYKCYPELKDSTDCPEVAADCNYLRTNLFYIEGKRLDEYITDVIGFTRYKDIPEDSRDVKGDIAATVLMDAIYSKGKNVDVKTYCRNADGKCELKVRPVVRDSAPEMSEESKKQHQAFAAQIIKNDKIAEKVNQREAPSFERQHKSLLDRIKQFFKLDKTNRARVAESARAESIKLHKAAYDRHLTEDLQSRLEQDAAKQFQRDQQAQAQAQALAAQQQVPAAQQQVPAAQPQAPAAQPQAPAAQQQAPTAQQQAPTAQQQAHAAQQQAPAAQQQAPAAQQQAPAAQQQAPAAQQQALAAQPQAPAAQPQAPAAQQQARAAQQQAPANPTPAQQPSRRQMSVNLNNTGSGETKSKSKTSDPSANKQLSDQQTETKPTTPKNTPIQHN